MKAGRKGFQKGSALTFVIIVFVIVTIIVGAMYTLFNTNLRQTVYQKNSIKAYYCTLAGIEIATGALLMKSNTYDPILSPDEPKNLLETFIKDDPSDPPKVLTETLYLPLSDGITAPAEGKSKVDLTISSSAKPGSSVDYQWIRIDAVGTYVDAGGKAYTNKGTMWYRADNPAIFEQELNP